LVSLSAVEGLSSVEDIRAEREALRQQLGDLRSCRSAGLRHPLLPWTVRDFRS
jgi:hypothetical protein